MMHGLSLKHISFRVVISSYNLLPLANDFQLHSLLIKVINILHSMDINKLILFDKNLCYSYLGTIIPVL